MELGIYGPNRPQWDDADYDAIAAAGVRHVLARSDCDREVFEELVGLGVEVYVQVTDYFARFSWLPPGARADELYFSIRQKLPHGGYVILDNEPDLGHGHQAQWYAEQWCRWYRALYNEFRFWDHEGRYRLIMPGLTAPLDEARLAWWMVGAENVAGHTGVGIHVYWGEHQLADFEEQREMTFTLREMAGRLPLYCLEFGSPASAGDWERRVREYAYFGRFFTPTVAVGFPFILNPTPDWSPYAISGKQLVELAAAWHE